MHSFIFFPKELLDKLRNKSFLSLVVNLLVIPRGQQVTNTDDTCEIIHHINKNSII